MATVNKNFRVKNGLVVEGSTATVNGYDILTKSSADESYIIDLIGGQATSANTANTVVKRDGSGNFSAGTITANLTGDVTGTVSSLSNHNTDDLSEGSNLYFTNQRALDATAAAYDAAGSATSAASAAQSAAESYADGLVNGLDTDDIEEGASNLYFTNGRARNAMGAGTGLSYDSSTGTFSVSANTYDNWGAASAAEAAANSYTDNSINALDTDDIDEGMSNQYFTNTRARGAISAGTGISYDSGTGVVSVDNTIATQSYVDTAVSNLIDGAPGLLDTLNEIAAAINDDANYFTTIANNLAAKLDLAGGTLTGALTLHADPSSALHAATKQYVDAAESAAQSAAESTAQAALDDVLDGTTDFTAIDVNSVSRQIAATTGNIVTAASTAAISWNKTDYRSAKILVKAKNGSHTHISEVIVTLDTSDNIALNEYGITTTNGSLMTIDADINSGNVRLLVTPAHNNTEVMAHATLLA